MNMHIPRNNSFAVACWALRMTEVYTSIVTPRLLINKTRILVTFFVMDNYF